MKIFHGLAVALFFLETILVPCDGAEMNKQILPDDLIGEIIAKAGLKITKEMAQAKMNLAGIAMRRIFETYIIKIALWRGMTLVQPPVIEFPLDGDKCIVISNYTTLMLLFQQYGSYVRRIHIRYNHLDEPSRREINKNIINRHANQFTELQISTEDDTRIWAEMANGNRDIRFPNVENFIWLGNMKRSELDLNAIFPRLKFFRLWGSVTDTNCLANVKNLEELNLSIDSIQEHQLGKIFRNNQKISTLTLKKDMGNTIKKDILRSIENLKNLKTLNLVAVASDFFNRASDRVYNLSSVTSFKATFFAEIISSESISFDMPKLKDLQLFSALSSIDDHISDIINHFKALETLLLNVLCNYDIIECIQKLKYVKEFTTNCFYRSQFPSLEQFFANFDKRNSKLNKLMFLINDEYTFYEEAMHEINNKLRSCNKPTWTISRISTSNLNGYMMFKRST